MWIVVLFGALTWLVCPRDVQSQEQPPTILIGRLATVEPAARRLTFVPEGEVDLVEVFVAEDGSVHHDGRELSLSELVVRVGRVVKVSYRTDGERRIAESVIVEPE
jgi:hypothetical protein